MLKFKRIVTWLALSILTAGVAIACATSPSDRLDATSSADASSQAIAQECRTIEHDLGETEICGKPEKIVALSGYTLDLLLSLDEQPAGYTGVAELYGGEVYDNPAEQIPYLGDRITTQPVNLGNAATPSLERLVQLKPDLILGEAGRNANNYDAFSQIAPTILWNTRTASGQWKESLRDLAKALGEAEKAETVIEDYNAMVAGSRADFAEVVAEHPQILLLGSNSLEERIYAVNVRSYLGELLEGVGFKVIPDTESNIEPSLPISLEVLPELNDADTIVVLGFNMDLSDRAMEDAKRSAEDSGGDLGDLVEKHQLQTIRKNWQENAIAQTLSASQNDRVFFATFAKWNGLNGAIGAELVLEELREFLLKNEVI